MNFRTEIEVSKSESKIDYSSRIFTIGSCFAENIAGVLSRYRFRTTVNPLGVMFNPLSILSTLRRLHTAEQVTPQRLGNAGEIFFSYDFHSSCSDTDADAAIRKMNNAVCEGHAALTSADWVIITLGTAWIYELTESGSVVANCHKQPSSLFTRRRLTVEEVTSALATMIDTYLADKHVILTVSPVRHTGDGLQDNSVSKATLRVAVEQICEQYAAVKYFPSYEILIDDLRDYRYYADDMVHPSTQAVEYIREKFAATYFGPHTAEIARQVEQITTATAHRPFNPRSSSYRAFCRKQLEAIGHLPQVDLTVEKEFFENALQTL